MDSNQVLVLVDRIAADSKKTVKEQLLREHKDCQTLQRVLNLALNPFYTFGVQSLPSRTGNGSRCFDECHWRLLDDLRTRTLTGGAARAALQEALNALSAQSAELLGRIVRKDLRAGFGENTVNKVLPKFIPVFPYMRCSLPTEVHLASWPWAEGIFSQEKADGMFANGNVEPGFVTMTTRQGTPIPLERMGALAEQMERHLTHGFQYHGEVLVERLDSGKWSLLPRQEGNGVLNSIEKGGDMPDGHRAVYLLWDAIPLSAVQPKGKYEKPYKQRVEALQAMLAAAAALDDGLLVGMIPMRLVHSLGEAFAHYAEMLEAGKEGTIVKKPDAIWADTTSADQVKLKLAVQVELEITGFNPGKGKNAATFGSIATKSSCGQLVVNVNARGDAQRADIHARREELLGTIITAKANGLMRPKKPGAPWSLFLPVLVELRSDKTQADSLERIQQQFQAAMLGQAAIEKAAASAGHSVASKPAEEVAA